MTFYRIIKLSLLFIIPLLIFAGCQPKSNADPAYLSKIQQWHQKRISNLKKDNGWLNLAGLFWLKEGENSFGSAKDNDIIFPSGPKHIGKFILTDSIVTVKILGDVEVFNNGKRISEMKLKSDQQDSTTILQNGNLRWYVIKRGKEYGIRLRDLNSPNVKNFKGIEIYPIDTNWRVTAKFIAYDPPKEILVPTEIGTIEKSKSPGALIFKINNIEYKLDALDEGDSFFMIFADETNGSETYGAGRFLYTDKPDSNGNVILDFNKAYNPPCAFSKFATCPLPPKQNYLHLKVTAGEKKYEYEFN